MYKIIIVVIIIILIGIGGYYLLGRSYKSPALNGNPQTETNTNPAIENNNTENQITIKNFTFNPSTLTIKMGATVTWINNDSAPHQIKSNIFNSEIFNNSESFQFAFSEKGTFEYTCGIHPFMQGKIVVE